MSPAAAADADVGLYILSVLSVHLILYVNNCKLANNHPAVVAAVEAESDEEAVEQKLSVGLSIT